LYPKQAALENIELFKAELERSRASRDGYVPGLTAHKVFLKLFGKSQFPHKSVDLFFLFVTIQNRLTDLCRN
jgi:hypothetical protein